jgi:hypothetical protein
MKTLLIGILSLGMANFCHAQAAGKKEQVKFTPPVIKKDHPATKSSSTQKIPPPVIVQQKFPPPAIKKDKTRKKIK